MQTTIIPGTFSQRFSFHDSPTTQMSASGQANRYSRIPAKIGTPSSPSGRRGRRKEPDFHPYVVVDRSSTTILPWGERTGDCLEGSLRRHSSRYTDRCNHGYFCRQNDSNNDANVLSNNVSNSFADISPYNAAYSCSRSLRFSAGFSHRRSCRRSALRSERSFDRRFPTCNVGCFDRPNRGQRLRSRQRERSRLASPL